MLRRNNTNQNAANNNQAPANGQQQGGDRRSYNTLIQPAHVEYDRYTSALRLGFGHGQYRGFGMIELTPVFEEKRGAEAKKGESLFNYNDKMMVRITAQDAIVLRKQLAAIRNGVVEETILNTSANKSITLLARPFDVCDLPEQYQGTRIGIISSELKDGASEPLEYIWVCEHVDYEIYENCNTTSSEIFMEIFDSYLGNVISHCTSGQFVTAGAAVQAYGNSAPAGAAAAGQRSSGFRRRSTSEAAQGGDNGDNMGGEADQGAAQQADAGRSPSGDSTARSNGMAAARAARQQQAQSTQSDTQAPVATASVSDFLEGFDENDQEEPAKF